MSESIGPEIKHKERGMRGIRGIKAWTRLIEEGKVNCSIEFTHKRSLGKINEKIVEGV